MLYKILILFGIFTIVTCISQFQEDYEKQIKKEFDASNLYLTFANSISTAGVYNGFAQWFYESSEEERTHGKMLIEYFNLRNRPVQLTDLVVRNETVAVNDLTEMITEAYKMEVDVLNSLNTVRQSANSAQDYPTVHFIEKHMLEEQTVAVKFMYDLKKRLERNADNSKIILQMLDQDLRNKQIKIIKP